MKKGLSAVIAITFLILLVIASAAAFLSFASPLLKTDTRKAKVETMLQKEEVQFRDVKIEVDKATIAIQRGLDYLGDSFGELVSYDSTYLKFVFVKGAEESSRVVETVPGSNAVGVYTLDSLNEIEKTAKHVDVYMGSGLERLLMKVVK